MTRTSTQQFASPGDKVQSRYADWLDAVIALDTCPPDAGKRLEELQLIERCSKLLLDVALDQSQKGHLAHAGRRERGAVSHAS